MKKIMVFLVASTVLILSGCGSDTVIKDATVLKKENHPRNTTGTDYYVTFEKDGQKFKLETHDTNEYEALFEGSVVDVEFDNSDFVIDEINYSNLEGK